MVLDQYGAKELALPGLSAGGSKVCNRSEPGTLRLSWIDLGMHARIWFLSMIYFSS